MSDYPGTQHYAAPEIVLRAKHYKASKADVWALGVRYSLIFSICDNLHSSLKVLLFAMATGGFPFDGPDSNTVNASIVKSNPKYEY